MASTDVFVHDPQFPPFHGAVRSSEIRRELGALATHQRSATNPAIPGQVVGDVKTDAGTFDLSVRKYLIITTNKLVDSSLHTITVDCSSQSAGHESAATITEIVTAINNAFTATAGTIAYNVDNYLLLKSGVTGSSSKMKITQYTDSNDSPAELHDASDQILGLAYRGSSPWTFDGSEQSSGTLWNYATTVDGRYPAHELRYRNQAAAKIISKQFVSGTVTGLGARVAMYITVGPPDNGLVVGYPVSGGSITLTSIVNTTNAAFGFALASLVDGGTRVQFANPVSGPGSYVRLEPLSLDMSPIVFGLPNGMTRLDEYDRACTSTILTTEFQPNRPVIEYGSDWLSMIRGCERFAGVGLWGPAVDSAELLPPTGFTDGELRAARDTGILWGYNIRRRGALTSTTGWSRAVPAGYRHIQYSNAVEGYQLRTTYDYNPQPIVKSSGVYNRYLSTANVSNVLPDINVSDVPELVDARDERWITPQSGGSNSFAAYGTGARVINRDKIHKDDFNRSNTSVALGLTASGDSISWLSKGYDANGNTAQSPAVKIDSNKAILLSSDCNGPDFYTFSVYQDQVLYNGLPATPGNSAGLMVSTECSVSSDNANLFSTDFDFGHGVLLRADLGCQSGLVVLVDMDVGGFEVRGKIVWGKLSTIPGGTGFTYLGDSVTTDGTYVQPPTDGAGQVLRVEASGVATNTTLKVWWTSSTDRTRWAQDELTPTYTISGINQPTAAGAYCGVVLHNTTTNNAISVKVDKFQAIATPLGEIPGLPEVSGARLRDTITSAQLGTWVSSSPSGIVNDCTPEKPLQFCASDGSIIIDQNTPNRQFDWKVKFPAGGGGGTGGGPGGTGGGSPPTIPPDPGIPGNPGYKIYPGSVFLEADRTPTILLNIHVRDLLLNGTVDVNPEISISPINLQWNRTYLSALNLKPTGWDNGSIDTQIRDLVTFNTAEYARSAKTAPPAGSTLGGNDWGAISEFQSALRMLAALNADQSKAKTSNGLPTWLSTIVGTATDPGTPYTSTFAGPTEYFLPSVATQSNLPTTGSGGQWDGLTPPSGIVSLSRADNRFFSWNGSTWTAVNGGQNSFSSLSVYDSVGTLQGTISATTASDLYSLRAGTGISFSVDVPGKSVTVTNSGGGGGGGGTDYINITDGVNTGTDISTLTVSGDEFAVTPGTGTTTLTGLFNKVLQAGSVATYGVRPRSNAHDFYVGGDQYNNGSFSLINNPNLTKPGVGALTNPLLFVRNDGRIIVSGSSSSGFGLSTGFSKVLIQSSSVSTIPAVLALSPHSNTADVNLDYLLTAAGDGSAQSTMWRIKQKNFSDSANPNALQFVDQRNGGDVVVQLTPYNPTTLAPAKISIRHDLDVVGTTSLNGDLTFTNATPTITGGGSTKTVSKLFDYSVNTVNNLIEDSAGSGKILMLQIERDKLATIEECADESPDILLNGATIVDAFTDDIDALNFSSSFTATYNSTTHQVDIGLNGGGGGGGGISSVKENGTQIVGAATALNFAGSGFTVTADGTITTQANVALQLGSNLGLVFDGGGNLVPDFGSGTATKVATGTHAHGVGGYSTVDWTTGVSGKPSTFTPSAHVLDDAAVHTGNLSASKVLTDGSFDTSGTYKLGKNNAVGLVLHVGHDGTSNPPICNTMFIKEHAHSAALGSGGQINYSNLAGIPADFTPKTHAGTHLAGQTDQLNGESMATSFDPTTANSGYSATAGSPQLLANHLAGISNQLAAEAYFYITCPLPPTFGISESLYLLGAASPTNGIALPALKSSKLVNIAINSWTAPVGSSYSIRVRNATTSTDVGTSVSAGTSNFATSAQSATFSAGDKVAIRATCGIDAQTIRGGLVTLSFQLLP